MKAVAKNTAYLTGASLIQKALSFIYFIVLSRAFGASGIGAYSYALSFTTIFAILVDGGVTPVLIREIAAHPASARALLKRALTYKGIFLFFAAALMLLVGVHLEAARSVALLIAVAAGVMLFDSLNLTLYGVLRGFHTVQMESIGLLVAQAIAIIFGLSTVFLHLPLVIVVAGLGAASITNSCLAGTIVRKKLAAVLNPEPCKLTHRAYLAEALPFGLAGAFARGYSYLDALIIGETVSVTAVGLYSIANKLTFAFQFLPLALSATLYPAFAAELSEKTDATPARICALWENAERYLVFVGAGIVAALVALSADVLHIYGSEFVQARFVLMLLALSLVASFVSYPLGALLNAARLQKLQTMAMGVTFALNAVLNLILIPRIGIFGAAIAAFCGNLTLVLLGAYFAHTRVVKLPWRNFALRGMIALLSALCAGVVMSILRTHLWWPVAGCIGAAVYAAALLLLRGISVAECKMLFMRMYHV